MAREDITPNPNIDRDDDDLMEQEGGDRASNQADDAGIGVDEDDEFDDSDDDVDEDDENSDVDE